MKKNYLFFLMLQCLFQCQLHSQSSNPYFLPKVFPKTPNSASLERYGDYQVNLFTGVPDISIPLYEIQSGDLKVPVTLSYHASGNKVTDVASWVGLGWSLNAGGEITRRMMGNLPDENPLSGYLFTNLRHPSTLTMNNDADLRYVDNIRMGITDVEPDIFSFNFPGKSGKFFFNRMGTDKIQLVPFTPVKVTKTITTQNNVNNLSFNINDELGNQFTFGESEREISNVGQPNSAASSWMLEKMISQNQRDVISFSYTSSYLNIADVFMFQTVSDNIQNHTSTPAYTSGWDTYPTTNPTLSSTYQKLLQQINFKNGRLTFGLSTNDRQDVSNTNVKSLNNIVVYGYNYATGQYTIQKTITFYQSYFTGFPNDYSTKRLRLDSIFISDAAGIVIQRYRFDYNNTIGVPQYTSLSRDYWGYFNNRNNSSLIPQQQVYYQGDYYSKNITIGSDNPVGREPDANYSKLCMLNKITFPTGGYTDFEFEANRYVENGNEKLAGGFRIKSIKSYNDLNASPIIKTYNYESARKNFILENFSFVKEQTYRFYGSGDAICCTVLRSTKRLRTFSSSPAIDPVPFDGATVVYPIVTEYIGDQSVNTGKTVFTFRDHTDQYFGSWPVFDRPVVNSYFFARGQLAENSVYIRKPNASFQVAQKESYQYAAFPETGYDQIVGLSAAKNIINEGDIGNDVYLGVSTAGSIGPGENDLNSYSYLGYLIVSDDNNLTLKTTTVYDQNDITKFSTTNTEYKYDNILHQQVNRQITTDSKSNIHTTYNRYPADYLPSKATSTGHLILDAMLSKNMQATSIETYQNISAGSSTATTEGKFKNYKQINANAVELDYIKSLEIAAPVNNFQPSMLVSSQIQNDARYKNVISYDVYDGSANLLQYTPGNSSSIAVLYDYNNIYPICEVKNASVNNIAYTSFEADGLGNWEGINNTYLQSSGGLTGIKWYNLNNTTITKNSLTTTIKYIVSYWTKNVSPYGITGTMTGWPKELNKISFNGQTWINYAHLITGVSLISITGTGAIDELRLYPQGAQMTTYTYNPLVGMASQTDINNRTTYFKYDNFNRLKNIKDNENNIVKRYEYAYAKHEMNSISLEMRNFADNNTISYPVGVFDVNGVLIGNASDASSYTALWNGNIANAIIGILFTVPGSPLKFTLTLNNGQAALKNVTGCRYYQYDIEYSQIDGIINPNGCFVDFGDGSNMRLGKSKFDVSGIVLPANTAMSLFSHPYFIHTYYVDGSTTLDNSLHTITIYHNDGSNESPFMDNRYSPAESLKRLKNLRGTIPQNVENFGASCFQQATALNETNITNWNSINSIKSWVMNIGDDQTAATNLSYSQDFLKNNKGLNEIQATREDYFKAGYLDASFKLTKLKSDWNTYFTELASILIREEHWNHENLSALVKLKNFLLVAANTNHSNTQSGNSIIDITPQNIDKVINEIAAGAGTNVYNGFITILSGTTTRTSSSDAAISLLKSKGWVIKIKGVSQ